ncbi:hypothetical protein AB0E67_27125 [Streptomyces sp. NPDC032161]|uniref:hypothetical protein n=1 Tax=unclassified Streptomyces TaxID=2593676 RepID=UPI00340E113A
MAGKLAASVYVTDPETRQTVILDMGSTPEPRLAALVTNPAAWEDGVPPDAVTVAEESTSDSDAAESKQAAKRAARKPARGRTAAAEGDGGQ